MEHQCELVIGCEHLCQGIAPDVLFADDNGHVTIAMCKGCADWYDAEGYKLSEEDQNAIGRLRSVCLICHDYKHRVPFGGFWLSNGDGNYIAQKTSVN